MDKGENKNMQKQIDYLTIQFEQLKNQVNKEKRNRRDLSNPPSLPAITYLAIINTRCEKHLMMNGSY